MVPAHVIKAVERHVVSALVDAKRAKSCVDDFSSSSNTRQLRAEVGMSLYALKGLNDIGVAEALYLSQSESEGEFDALQDIIDKYRFFASEIVDNVATNHSHQWSLIHYNELCDAVRGTPFWIDILDA